MPYIASNTITFFHNAIYYVVVFIGNSSEKVSPVASLHGCNHLVPAP
jgi:hypothetical protein